MTCTILAIVTTNGVYAGTEAVFVPFDRKLGTPCLVPLGSWEAVAAPHIPLHTIHTVVPVMLSDDPDDPDDGLARSLEEWAEGRGYRLAGT